MEILNVITRCSRLKNLLKVSESIINQNKFDLRWFVVFDKNAIDKINIDVIEKLQSINAIVKFEKSIPGDHGHQFINLCLDEINDGWVYVLDDDNIIHEDFYEDIHTTITTNQDKRGIIFHQKIGGIDFTGQDVRISSPDDVRVSKIDMAQFVLRRDLIGNNRIELGKYVADGIFIESIYNQNPNDFIFLDKILCYYNYFKQISSINKKFLPRVLILGQENIEDFKSRYLADYESTDLFTLSKSDDRDLDKIMKHFDPDAILTLGDTYEKYSILGSKPYEIRRRWIHSQSLDSNSGETAYLCASNFILTPHSNENPLVSLFTPIYNTGEKLWRTYQSLKNQTYQNWEWVMVNDSNDEGYTLNIAEKISEMDHRVKVYDFHTKTGGIVGESKYRAACLCNGVYLMELDHDDIITPDAVELMVVAFKKYPDCKFVYSDFAEIDENHNSLTYGESFSFDYGSYRDEMYDGRIYKTVNTSNINPKTIRHIVGVPNHFRAWDRFFYHSIGGHNRRLSIADDYELIVRTFLKTKMVRIPKLLYLQFYHNSNTQNATRSDIQRRVRTISNFYNLQIRNRFSELGVEDWAYNFNPNSPLSAPSKHGTEEGSVNYVLELVKKDFTYDWTSIK
jgi:glycosyltransferase involved in cell wall biosynthesis